MKITTVLILPLLLMTSSCKQIYDPATILNGEEYSGLLLKLAPYVNKKPKKASYQERFSSHFVQFYRLRIDEQQSEIKFFYKKDSLNYFFYVNRDLSSLYEHYRGNGGYFIYAGQDSIKILNILYCTPRWTKEDVKEKGKKLFSEMVNKHKIDRFLGNKAYIHTPNEDFYYDAVNNKWEYTENSSWGFLKEAREDP